MPALTRLGCHSDSNAECAKRGEQNAVTFCCYANKERKSNPDDWDRKKPQNNTVESLKVSRNLVIAICLNHDLEKDNSKCEKRKLRKRYYVNHGIKPNYSNL